MWAIIFGWITIVEHDSLVKRVHHGATGLLSLSRADAKNCRMHQQFLRVVWINFVVMIWEFSFLVLHLGWAGLDIAALIFCFCAAAPKARQFIHRKNEELLVSRKFRWSLARAQASQPKNFLLEGTFGIRDKLMASRHLCGLELTLSTSTSCVRKKSPNWSYEPK